MADGGISAALLFCAGDEGSKYHDALWVICRLGLRNVDLSGPTVVEAQQTARSELRVSCPPTMSITYRKVSAFEPDGAKGKIDGFTPVFLAGSVRLMQAGIAVGVEGKELDTIMDDQAQGKLMRWSNLNDASLPSGESAHVKCEYEGGAYLERALPRPIKSCTLESTMSKPEASTTRTFITRAIFSCR